MGWAAEQMANPVLSERFHPLCCVGCSLWELLSFPGRRRRKSAHFLGSSSLLKEVWGGACLWVFQPLLAQMKAGCQKEICTDKIRSCNGGEGTGGLPSLPSSPQRWVVNDAVLQGFSGVADRQECPVTTTAVACRDGAHTPREQSWRWTNRGFSSQGLES